MRHGLSVRGFVSGPLSVLALASAAAALAINAGSVAIAAIPNYTLVGSYALPGGTWDVGNDGRLWSIVGTSILRQDAINSSSYSPIGSVAIANLPSFGAAFIAVNAATGQIAIGDNNSGPGSRVHFVSAADLNTSNPTATQSVEVGNYNAAWDGNHLYVTGANNATFAAQVARIDFTNSTGAPIATTVIDNAGDFSGGIAIRGSTLYTGVGFSFGGLPSTGDIRSFNTATFTGAPIAYSSGALITELLSAASLGFDSQGNLLVGGGRFGGTDGVDTGFAAVVDLANVINPLKLAPAGFGGFHGIAWNDATGELLVSRSGIAYRYAIPAPSAAAMLLGGFAVAARRRRR